MSHNATDPQIKESQVSYSCLDSSSSLRNAESLLITTGKLPGAPERRHLLRCCMAADFSICVDAVG